MIKPQMRVRIHGLKQLPQLNGEDGVVVGWDKEAERWNLLLDNEMAWSNGSALKCRAANLMPLLRVMTLAEFDGEVDETAASVSINSSIVAGATGVTVPVAASSAPKRSSARGDNREDAKKSSEADQVMYPRADASATNTGRRGNGGSSKRQGHGARQGKLR